MRLPPNAPGNTIRYSQNYPMQSSLLITQAIRRPHLADYRDVKLAPFMSQLIKLSFRWVNGIGTLGTMYFAKS